MGQGLEFPVSSLDLFIIKAAQAIKTEGLDVHRSHDAAEDDRLAQALFGKVHGARQKSHETAGECISRPGGIEYGFEGIGRRAENVLSAEHNCAVAPLLNHDRLWPHCLYGLGGLNQTCFTRKLPELRLVDGEQINLLERPLQGLKLAGNPVIHGVARH